MSLVQLGGSENTADARRIKEALAQASLCRALSLAFRPPVPGLAAELVALAAPIPGAAGERVRGLANLVTPELEADYHRAFGPGGACRICEADHLPWRTIGGKGAILGDVSGFYQAFHFDPAVELAESPDHLAIELSFAGWLWVKEANALHLGRKEEAELSRRASRAFSDEHFAPWLERFCGRAREVVASEFHREAVEILAEVFESVPQEPESAVGAPDSVALSGVPVDEFAGAPLVAEGLMDTSEVVGFGAEQRPLTHRLSGEHRIVERVLDQLGEAVERGDDRGLLTGLAFFSKEMPLHRRKEEEVLFVALAEVPALRHGPVRAMLLEHQEEERLLTVLHPLAQRVGSEPEVWGAIRQTVEALQGLLRAHIEKEDQVLYGLAEQVLAGPSALSIAEAFNAIGWVGARA